MRKVLFVVLILLIAGCTKINYIGEQYPPTTHVDMYFSEEDVEKEYKVMGHVEVIAGEFVDVDKMQKDLMEKAREVGADGVIILGLDEYVTGQRSSWSESTVDKEHSSTTSGSTSSTPIKEKKIKSLFIKYK